MSEALTNKARSGELLQELLRILKAHPEGLQAKEALAALRVAKPPTELESGQYASGADRYRKLVRFYSINLVKAGWLVKDGGRWSATEDGLKALNDYADPSAFAREASRRYQAWSRTQEEADVIDDTEVVGAAETAVTLEEAQEQALSEIAAYLGAMNPYDFQKLVGMLLIGMGYHLDYNAPPGPDGGIDLIAYSDPLGADGSPRIKVQVKRRKDRADVDAIRAFSGLLSPQDVGLFVCLGGFKETAQREVRAQEGRRMLLVDLDRLLELWVMNIKSIPEEGQRLLPLTPVHFLNLT